MASGSIIRGGILLLIMVDILAIVDAGSYGHIQPSPKTDTVAKSPPCHGVTPVAPAVIDGEFYDQVTKSGGNEGQLIDGTGEFTPPQSMPYGYQSDGKHGAASGSGKYGAASGFGQSGSEGYARPDYRRKQY